MREDISKGIDDVLRRMLKNGVNEGKMTCTLTIRFEEEEITGMHGMLRMAKTPIFEHKVKSSVAQGISVDGRMTLRGVEVTNDANGDPVFRDYARQQALFDIQREDDDDEA